MEAKLQDTRSPRHVKWPCTDGIAMFQGDPEDQIQGSIIPQIIYKIIIRFGSF